MRVGQSNIARSYLTSNVKPKQFIEDIAEHDTVFADVYKKETKGNYYKTEKSGRIELGETAYFYLLGVFEVHGIVPDVRLVTEVKDERKETEDWTEISNVGIDLSSMKFNDVEKTVSIETVQGGFIDTLEARWGDDFDITSIDGLPFVNVRLEGRSILNRSKFKASEIEVNAADDQGATARFVPLEIDYRSQPSFIGPQANFLANSVNDTYADQSLGGFFMTNAPQDFTYTFNGTVEIEVTGQALGGYLHMDLVRFSGGEDFIFEEVVLRLDSGDPATLGEILTHTFNDYQVNVNQGESLGIMTISDTTGFGSFDLKYVSTENVDFRIKTNDPFPTTYSKALKFKDAAQRLVDLAAPTETVTVEAPAFDDAAGYTDLGEVLLMHGTWLRNMPQILNEGEENERRLQSNLSLKKLYGGYKILHPLRYEPKTVKGQNKLHFGLEKESQQNFISIKIKENGTYIPPIEPQRNVLTDLFYGKITLGSTTSGENYEETNNLYSICGNASWFTINDKIDKTYEVTTEFRTGAEDIELTRSKQYADNPDFDTPYDNDWFLVHAQKVGNEYQLIKWQFLYSEQPKNTFDPNSNYNWIFRPRNLLENHAWKIKPCLTEKLGDKLRFGTSNCDSSAITKRSGEEERPENGDVPHTQLEKATIRPMEVEFETVVRQEIIEQFRGQTNDMSNLFGLVAYKYESNVRYGRLLEGDLSKDGKLKLVEAV